jgi:hypothetical protein
MLTPIWTHPGYFARIASNDELQIAFQTPSYGAASAGAVMSAAEAAKLQRQSNSREANAGWARARGNALIKLCAICSIIERLKSLDSRLQI